MASRSPRLLFAGAWVVVAAYAVVFAWGTASGYARIAFSAGDTEFAVAASNCRDTPECAPDATAYLSAQLSALDDVATIVRGTAWLITVADVALLVIATVALLTGRPRSAGRLLGIAWVVQVVVTVLLFLGYAGLLLHGQSVRAGQPRQVWMPTFDSSFASPLTDFGTYYYAGWFVLMNATAVLLIRAVSRALRPVSAEG